jgi:hypothetical protein
MRTLTRPPIIAKQGNDYLVTDEFVERMVVLSEYMEKVDEWKAVNSVP